jgi:hypothetical protein
LGNEKRDNVVKLFDAARIIDPSVIRRSAIGTMLQSARPWERSMTWAKATAIHESWSGSWDAHADRTVSRYDDFVAIIRELNLPTDIEKPPILDASRPYLICLG